ncbi:MAG: outer membrane protein assembly factor, partial [Bacteroidota bacterium]
NNFMGRGQNINFNMSLASNQQIYNVGFTEPYLFDTKWTAGADYFRTVSNFIRSFSYEKHGFDLRVGHPIADYTRLFLTYRYEDNSITNVANPTIDPKLENGSAGSLQGSIVHDKRNNVFEPTNGYYGSTSLEYTGVGGIQRWLRADVEGRYYKPIWEDLVFRTRMMAAQLYRTEDRGIPRIERFSLGGARNMRGYRLEDIGPLIQAVNKQTGSLDTFNKGGLMEALWTFELEHPLIKEAGLKWVVFSDLGNVWEERIGEDGDYSLRANYGFGFRWFSPIGVLRFEFGFPINKREREAPNQFHFDIGQLF